MSTFFKIRQNNSGGKFNPPAVNVIIEASNKDEACKRASQHLTLCGDSGLYAEYDSCGCCPCCGHRWSEPYNDEPEDSTELVEEIRKDDLLYMDCASTALIKVDGTIITGDTLDHLEVICSYIAQAK